MVYVHTPMHDNTLEIKECHTFEDGEKEDGEEEDGEKEDGEEEDGEGEVELFI